MSRLRLSSFVLLACAILLFSSWGCSSQTGPEATETSSAEFDLNHPRYFDDEGGKKPFEEFEVVKDPTFVRILSTQGGPGPQLAAQGGMQGFEEFTKREIEAEAGGIMTNANASLYFPRNALSQNTNITMEMDPSGNMIVECGPDGIQFNKRIIFYLNLEGTNYEGRADLVDILWLDESTGKWMLIEQLPHMDANHPGALLDHFSKYSGVSG